MSLKTKTKNNLLLKRFKFIHKIINDCHGDG